MLQGMLLIYKPVGMTSHDVVWHVRQKLGMQRVGHTGTLDPMAEGLLILLVGDATQHQRGFQSCEKTYEALLQLGAQTDTADATGIVLHMEPVPVLDRLRIRDVLASFEGPQLQIPPAYSAIKVNGRPAYWWARRKKPVLLAPRKIHIYEIEFKEHDARSITFRLRCSGGTYVRTLAETVAQRLGTTGYLSKLVRLSVGRWGIEEAKPFSWIRQVSPAMIACQLLPVSAPLDPISYPHSSMGA